MGDSPNLTMKILEQIRDEGRQTRDEARKFRNEVNARFDEVNARFDEVNARFDEVDARFEAVEKTIADMATQLVFLVKHTTNSGKRQSATEAKVKGLSKRVDRLEVRAGLKKPST